MKFRAALSADEIGAASRLRPAIRPAKAAAILDMDRSQIYRMVRKGDLEAHGIGTRGVRIYVDSIERYRSGLPKGGRLAPAKKPGKLGAEYHEACAHLKALGLL